ncbi:hypothetical protein [Pedobacter sp. HMWF019]|uniref:hypothetical protein n=1 Tax=Pedobacter sp. HMWF019 TaxID=2056856 RepID=UPI0018EEA721|nr:hypothetical protein [Pedobacter sp. HMWF019]
MQEPFDITIGHIDYAVFPEGNDTYAIFKDGAEYAHIQKDTDLQWIRLDMETGTPLFESDEEINQIGREILAYVPEPEEEHLDEEED